VGAGEGVLRGFVVITDSGFRIEMRRFVVLLVRWWVEDEGRDNLGVWIILALQGLSIEWGVKYSFSREDGQGGRWTAARPAG